MYYNNKHVMLHFEADDLELAIQTNKVWKLTVSYN